MDPSLQMAHTCDLRLTVAAVHIGITCFAICCGLGEQPHCKPKARFSAPSPYASRQAGRLRPGTTGRQAGSQTGRQAGLILASQTTSSAGLISVVRQWCISGILTTIRVYPMPMHWTLASVAATHHALQSVHRLSIGGVLVRCVCFRQTGLVCRVCFRA